MNTTNQSTAIISKDTLLKQWQGHRALTRRVIEAFPDQELFEFSIGGMRPFASMVKELLAIAAPGLKEMVTGVQGKLDEEGAHLQTKLDILNAWDESTEIINNYWQQLSAERFSDTFKLFGQYESPVILNILYFIDNEIHHRGQGYVYLRALGIEPPPFWDR